MASDRPVLANAVMSLTFASNTDRQAFADAVLRVRNVEESTMPWHTTTRRHRVSSKPKRPRACQVAHDGGLCASTTGKHMVNVEGWLSEITQTAVEPVLVALLRSLALPEQWPSLQLINVVVAATLPCLHLFLPLATLSALASYMTTASGARFTFFKKTGKCTIVLPVDRTIQGFPASLYAQFEAVCRELLDAATAATGDERRQVLEYVYRESHLRTELVLVLAGHRRPGPRLPVELWFFIHTEVVCA
jgi:hypothetical protein